MAEFDLYCMGESGNAYKVAILLELSGQDWQPIFVDFFKGGSKTPEFLALNPMGEVPTLVHGDVTLSQSGVIQDYLIEQIGQFSPQSKEDAREVLRWVLWDNHKLSSQIGTARFLNNFLPKDKRPENVYEFFQGRLKSAYLVLNNHLEGREWMVGNAPTAADFSCCSYLFYPEEYGFDRAKWPHIDAWLTRISELPGWKHPYDLMPRGFPPS